MGVTLAAPDENSERLIKRADLAMYTAKREGGDQVVTLIDDAAPAV